ncbi:hypothetical protein HAX54_030286, partial [Datura stramonium]|nr:hypothetical protein [Datura stramonium]
LLDFSGTKGRYDSCPVTKDCRCIGFNFSHATSPKILLHVLPTTRTMLEGPVQSNRSLGVPYGYSYNLTMNLWEDSNNGVMTRGIWSYHELCTWPIFESLLQTLGMAHSQIVRIVL